MNRRILAIAVVSVGGLFATGCTAIVVLIACIAMTMDNRIEFGNQSELYYSKHVSRAEAQAVADHLATMQEELGLEKQISYRLDRTDGRLTFGAVVLDNYENDLLTMTFMMSLTKSISDNCFQGEPVDFYAYDQTFKVKRVLSAEEGADALASEFVSYQFQVPSNE